MAEQGCAMRAFTPRGLPRNRQAIACPQVPPVNRGALPDGAQLRRAPIVYSGALPDGTEIRQAPAIGFG
jgi:hypothetical protein